MLLGKAHKFLENGRYQEALDKALKAGELDLAEQFEWLCHSIEGKARYHLGDKQNALPALQKAQEILSAKVAREKASRHLQNILDDVTGYIENIERGEP